MYQNKYTIARRRKEEKVGEETGKSSTLHVLHQAEPHVFIGNNPVNG